MEEKIFKPKTCLDCPVINIDKKDKDKVVCGVMRKLSANKQVPEEMKQMWNNCPIGWDKEEN